MTQLCFVLWCFGALVLWCRRLCHTRMDGTIMSREDIDSLTGKGLFRGIFWAMGEGGAEACCRIHSFALP